MIEITSLKYDVGRIDKNLVFVNPRYVVSIEKIFSNDEKNWYHNCFEIKTISGNCWVVSEEDVKKLIR